MAVAIFTCNRLFCCNHTCDCVNMVFLSSAPRYITSASRYHTRYQSRSSLYIRGLIPRNFAELAEAVPIASLTERLNPNVTYKTDQGASKRYTFSCQHATIYNMS